MSGATASAAPGSSGSPGLPRLPGRRIVLGAAWLGMIVYALTVAPPDTDGGNNELIMKMITTEIDGIDAWVFTIFNLLGVWPAIYAGVLLADGAGRRLPAWPFVLGSFALGGFALLPYLALREGRTDFVGERRGFVKIFDSRAMGIFLLVTSVALLGYGFLNGDPAAYLETFRVQNFVNVMSVDFVVLSLVFPSVLADDMERRGMHSAGLFWVYTCFPLIGPALYLARRERLPAPAEA